MKKIDFYQITDGQTGAQVASGLDENFNAIETALNEVESGAQPKNLIQLNPNSGIIDSEEDYNSILPASYLKQYPWKADYATGLPWLWMNFVDGVRKGIVICIKHNNKFCEFTDIPKSIGTVSEDKKFITLEQINEYVGFECQKDLGVKKAELAGIYQVYILNANGAVMQEIIFEHK